MIAHQVFISVELGLHSIWRRLHMGLADQHHDSPFRPFLRRRDKMKKMIWIILAIAIGLSGCLSFAPVEPGEDRPWDGLHDPYQIRGIK